MNTSSCGHSMFMILPWLFEKHFRHLTSSTRGTRRPSVQSPCTCPRGPYWSACHCHARPCLTHSKSMFEHHVFTLKDASEGIIIWQKCTWNYSPVDTFLVSWVPNCTYTHGFLTWLLYQEILHPLLPWQFCTCRFTSDVKLSSCVCSRILISGSQ